MASTALSTVLGSMVGEVQAVVFGNSIARGLILGAYGGCLVGLSLAGFAPASGHASQEPEPTDATAQDPAADPWLQEESSLG